MVIMYYSSDIEGAILGAVLHDPEYSLPFIQNLKPEYFYSTKSQICFKAIQELYKNGINPDIVTLGNYLKEIGKFDDTLGSWDTVIGLVEDKLPRQLNIPSSRNVKSHVKILLQNYVSRANKNLGLELQNKSIDAIEIKAKYEKKINEAESLLDDGVDVQTIGKSYAGKFLEDLESGKTESFLKTGFCDLDRFTNGFNETDFVIIASRTGIGKTAFGLNIIKNISKRKIPTCFISLEMDEKTLFRKLISAEANIDFNKILKNDLTRQEIKDISESVARLYSYPIYIDDRTGGKISNILNLARSLVEKKNIKLLVIDYLQLLTTGKPSENRHSELSEISRRIKSFALEYKTPVLGLAQLSRDIEKRVNKIPKLADLKDCGSLEQDADKVIFLSRLRGSEKENLENPDEADLTKVYVAKNRNGKEGMIRLNFFGEYQKFESYAEEKLPF